jgi:hypothetical protein
MVDYVKLTDLERYLFEDVGGKFRDSGKLKPLDLFLILHWKSRRAKIRNRDKLKKKSGSFEKATKQIATSLQSANSDEERLRALMERWGLRLPTASAILTVLYPEDFTIYDARVRRQLGLGRMRETYSQRTWNDMWSRYLRFKDTVMKETPPHLCLRDKDRYLWGKSLYEDADSDWRD